MAIAGNGNYASNTLQTWAKRAPALLGHKWLYQGMLITTDHLEAEKQNRKGFPNASSKWYNPEVGQQDESPPGP